MLTGHGPPDVHSQLYRRVRRSAFGGGDRPNPSTRLQLSASRRWKAMVGPTRWRQEPSLKFRCASRPSVIGSPFRRFVAGTVVLRSALRDAEKRRL